MKPLDDCRISADQWKIVRRMSEETTHHWKDGHTFCSGIPILTDADKVKARKSYISCRRCRGMIK